MIKIPKSNKVNFYFLMEPPLASTTASIHPQAELQISVYRNTYVNIRKVTTYRYGHGRIDV